LLDSLMYFSMVFISNEKAILLVVMVMPLPYE